MNKTVGSKKLSKGTELSPVAGCKTVMLRANITMFLCAWINVVLDESYQKTT